MNQWLGEDVVAQRTALADEIIGIPITTIERLRAQPGPTPPGMMREEPPSYGE